MKKLQKGRSMIEMLGVLAIIGVLSIGGLAGYTMAMNRHRANQILDYASRCAIVAQTTGDGYVVANDSCANLLTNEAGPLGIAYDVDGGAAGDTNFTVTTGNIASEDVRDILVGRSNATVTVAENGQAIVFTFAK
ncbi:MAG: hypothetical protein J6Y03_01040 [Alphaproteobacteria bacterium]|nr:hypothetical protein [Alphaproteobacteria bacterium]